MQCQSIHFPESVPQDAKIKEYEGDRSRFGCCGDVGINCRSGKRRSQDDEDTVSKTNVTRYVANANSILLNS